MQKFEFLYWNSNFRKFCWVIRTQSTSVLKLFLFYLSMVHGTLYIFFRNKTFLVVYIESWNFQHLFDFSFHEMLQNVWSFRKHSDDTFWGIKIVRMSWNFVRFQEILFQTDAEEFSFLSWQTKKVLFLLRSVNFKSNLWSANFSQKTNGQICFVSFFTLHGKRSFKNYVDKMMWVGGQKMPILVHVQGKKCPLGGR